MRSRAILLPAVAVLVLLAGACGGSGSASKTPSATATPSRPGAEAVIGDWVRTNRNVDFVGDCAKAKPGIDVGKLCATLAGTRGTRAAYNVGPTFSDGTALALVEQKPDGWVVISVTNRDPSAGKVPGIAWPLQIGDAVIVIGLGDSDCLSVREQPTVQGKRMICIPDGTKAIIQEGPVDAENFQWWRISGDGFNGWSVATWLRLPEAIAQALTPATPVPTP